MDKQEMFNRAWNGLKSQGFEQSMRIYKGVAYGGEPGGLRCAYAGDNGMRCAWGWVDLSLDEKITGGVFTLHRKQIGLAADLSSQDLEFASNLQAIHDESLIPSTMEKSLRDLASQHGLTIPE